MPRQHTRWRRPIACVLRRRSHDPHVAAAPSPRRARRVAARRMRPSAQATHARVTFLLVNDIYQMGEQAMPDGKRRGGFARLAAVVKAERAKGGHVIFAHAGDTLSPSLMSGFDRGAHIIALTNMIPPDIFVPGNHEFDFGKAIFLQRMAEAKFPLYAANLRGADGKPLPGFKDRADPRRSTACASASPAPRYDDTPRMSSPEDLQFAPTVATMQEQAEALRARRRRLRRRRDACRPQAGLRAARDARRRSHADRPRPRPVHQLRRPQRDGRVELRRPLRHRHRRHHRGARSRTASA